MASWHPRIASGIGRALLVVLMMSGGAVRARGEEAGEATRGDPSRSVSPEARDDLFFLGGSDAAWSVSKTKLGCLLLSPARADGMRTALGRHATYGPGLLFIGLSLAVPTESKGETFLVAAGGRSLTGVGRVVARDVVFVALSPSDLAVAVRELWYEGTLWVTVRQTSMAEGGHAVKKAVEEYTRACDGASFVP